MPCYRPLDGWFSRYPNENGNRYVVFNRREAQQDEPLKLPCGQCIGCRLEKARQWGVRCKHEAEFHDEKCFITLTYDDDHMPSNWSVSVEHWQKFMKRLRKRTGAKIRFMACGEYGENNDPLRITNLGRPHYHACLFGIDFQDREFRSKSKSGFPVYSSEQLAEIWTDGFATVQDFTQETADYTARYQVKKIYGEKAEEHYTWTDATTGETLQVSPEFAVQSRGRRADGDGGIGYRWYEKYKKSLHKGFITVDGNKTIPPLYYQKLWQKEFPDRDEYMKNLRLWTMDSLDPEYASDRLAVKEKVREKRTKFVREKRT